MKCDNMTGRASCDGTPTHVDRKGYVYCARCAEIRRAYRPVRKLAQTRRVAYADRAADAADLRAERDLDARAGGWL